MTRLQHAARIGLLMVGAAALLGWVLRHSEVCFADGLRYIHQAEQIDGGHWHDGLVGGIDHPLHPMGIAAVHRLLGGEGPDSWQRAALVLCFVSFVLLVVPVYILALELFGDRTAWLAALLVVFNPIVSLIAVNVLSESTFLLFWTFGLWGAVRFLREGRFRWLPLAIGFGGAGLPHASRGNALARGSDRDLGDPADASRHPDRPAQAVGCDRLCRGGSGVPGRTLHRSQRGRGDQTGDRPSPGDGTAFATLGPGA